MQEYKKEFIDFMVEAGVLTFGDFITKSGRKTPFFINTGNYTTGKQLKRLGEFYAKAIKENFHESFTILFGPAYKGIPLSVAASMALSDQYGIEVSYCSNRKEMKDHGDAGILLGSQLKDGDKVIIIEDVTTAGTSIYETMPILQQAAEVEVIGLVISVDRMEKGLGNETALTEINQKFGFQTCAIVTMAEIIEYLYGRSIHGEVLIDKEMRNRISVYYEQYGVK